MLNSWLIKEISYMNFSFGYWECIEVKEIQYESSFIVVHTSYSSIIPAQKFFLISIENYWENYKNLI